MVVKLGKRSWAKKAIVAAGITVALAAGTHFGLKAHVGRLNAEIAASNAARSATAAKEFPLDLSYRKLSRGKFFDVINNPNKPGNCSGYSLRVAAMFGKKFVFADAWDMGKKNRVVAQSVVDRAKRRGGFSKADFEKMISEGKISLGTIIGVYYPDSSNNRWDRGFTHMMVFVGKDQFWHNFRGPNAISLEEIFFSVNSKGQRKFLPVVVIEPAAK